jgi:hypothetical protein
MDRLEQQLNEIGFKTHRIREHNILVIEDYVIRVGPHASKTVRLGLSAGDFPFTPPAGIHVCPKLRPDGQNNINTSPLGSEWQYWSRRLPDWGKDRSARHIISYINKVFLNG